MQGLTILSWFAAKAGDIASPETKETPAGKLP